MISCVDCAERGRVPRTELLGQSPGISPAEQRLEDLLRPPRQFLFRSVVSGLDRWEAVNLRMKDEAWHQHGPVCHHFPPKP